MAFTPIVTASQALSNLNQIVLTDASTGSASISWRQVTIQKVNGDYLTPTGNATNYIIWQGNSNTKTVNVLDTDYALVITTNFFVGSTSTYTYTNLFLFKGYAESFKLSLSRFVASNPKLLDSKNFFENYSKLQTLIDSANQAVSLGNDQDTAQLMLNLATQLVNNQQLFM